MSAFVLDRKAILERLGGDEELYAAMSGMFVDDVATNCAVVSRALAEGDYQSLQREVHTIKGLLATFSDNQGAAQAQALEDQLRSGQQAGLEAAVAGLLQRLQELAALLSREPEIKAAG